MSLNITQADAATPPVLVELTGLPVVNTPAAGAVTGIVQRQVDGVRWETVRGCVDMEIDGSGNTADVPDYEFRPGVLNSYRGGVMQALVATFGATASSSWPAADTAQTWDAASSAFNAAAGVGTIVHTSANTTLRTVASAPVDLGDGRLSLSFKGSATLTGGTVSAAIVLHYVDSSNMYRVRVSCTLSTGMAISIEALIGGVLTIIRSTVMPDTYASTKTFRVEVDARGPVIRARAWDPVARPRPDWQLTETVSAPLRIAAGKVGVESNRSTGNTNVNFTFSFDDFVLDSGSPSFGITGLTDTLTPTLAGFWLCSVMRSFLNSAPMVIGYTEPTRAGRGDATYVAGRTLPIAQNEVMGGRTWTITFRAPSLASARRLEMSLASGDTFYLQTPGDCPIPFGHYRVPGMSGKRVTPRSDRRTFDVQLEEVAAPGPDITTAQNTWDSVIAEYGSWEAIVTAGVTWEDLRDDLIGDPDEVIIT